MFVLTHGGGGDGGDRRSVLFRVIVRSGVERLEEWGKKEERRVAHTTCLLSQHADLKYFSREEPKKKSRGLLLIQSFSIISYTIVRGIQGICIYRKTYSRSLRRSSFSYSIIIYTAEGLLGAFNSKSSAPFRVGAMTSWIPGHDVCYIDRTAESRRTRRGEESAPRRRRAVVYPNPSHWYLFFNFPDIVFQRFNRLFFRMSRGENERRKTQNKHTWVLYAKNEGEAFMRKIFHHNIPSPRFTSPDNILTYTNTHDDNII